MLAGVLACVAAGACAHPAGVPHESSLADADRARAAEVAADDSALRADSARLLGSFTSRGDVAPEPVPARAMHFASAADSLDFETNRALAAESAGFRIIVSLYDRHL
jgi:hypothetical protein